MKTPFILINFKTYSEATGKKALSLASKIEKAAEKHEVVVGVAVQHSDIRMLAESVSLPVYAQHVDAVSPGSHTGHVLAECVKEAGAIGTLLNHSEKRLTISDIDAAVRICKKVGLKTVVCTNNTSVSAAIAALFPSPEFVAVEPPELIGGDVSVSTARPEVVSESVKLVRKINPKICVLCGAGVKTGNDVYKALALGAEGVLLASGVVRAANPYAVVLELIRGVEKFMSEEGEKA